MHYPLTIHFCTLNRIRTYDPQLRRLLLYPTELSEHFVDLKGLEPLITEPKSAVLPLHHRSIRHIKQKCLKITMVGIYRYLNFKGGFLLSHWVHCLIVFTHHKSITKCVPCACYILLCNCCYVNS